MATTRLVVALALACAIDASVETERVDALGSGELARCVAEAKQASPTMQQIQAHPCPLKWAGAAADLPGYAYPATEENRGRRRLQISMQRSVNSTASTKINDTTKVAAIFSGVGYHQLTRYDIYNQNILHAKDALISSGFNPTAVLTIFISFSNYSSPQGSDEEIPAVDVDHHVVIAELGERGESVPPNRYRYYNMFRAISAGIETARRFGADYVLRLRVDMRLHTFQLATIEPGVCYGLTAMCWTEVAVSDNILFGDLRTIGRVFEPPAMAQAHGDYTKFSELTSGAKFQPQYWVNKLCRSEFGVVIPASIEVALLKPDHKRTTQRSTGLRTWKQHNGEALARRSQSTMARSYRPRFAYVTTYAKPSAAFDARSTGMRGHHFQKRTYDGTQDMLPNIATLLCSLEMAKTKYPRVVLASNIPSAEQKVLADLGATVIDTSSFEASRYWHPHVSAQQRLDGYLTYTKLLAWNLTQFDRIIYLDNDVTIQRSLDAVFTSVPGMVFQEKVWPGGAKGLNSHAFLISPSKHSFEMLLYIADERLYKPRTNTEQDVIEAWAAKQNVMDWDAVLELPRHSFINHHHCTGQGFPCVLRTWPGKSFDAAGPSCANFLGEAARRSHISLTS